MLPLAEGGPLQNPETLGGASMMLGGMRISLVGVVLLGLGCHPRGPSPALLACENGDGTGSLHGRVMVASDSTPAEGMVSLTGTTCRATASKDGVYSITGIPPGRYGVRAVGIGLHPSDTLEIEIKPDTTATLDIVLGDGPFYVEFDATWADHCAKTTLQSSSAAAPTSADSLSAVVACTNLAVMRPEPGFSDPTYCLSFGALVPADTLLLLRGVTAAGVSVRPPGECRLEGSELGSGVVDLQGKPAVIVELLSPRVVEDRAYAAASKYLAPLAAEGWNCRYARGVQGWRADRCFLTWIS